MVLLSCETYHRHSSIMSHQQRALVQRERDRDASFQHTQLGTYLAGAFGVMYLWASSAQVCASNRLDILIFDLSST